MQPLVNIAIQAARKAGKVILRALDRLDTLEIHRKGRHDLVTEIDHRAEQEIIRHLRRAYPDHGILAEESGSQGDEASQWIIDPLDGTTNFVHGFPQFAVSIAFRHRTRIEAAVVYDPLREEIFAAARGHGARLNDRRIRVSTARHLDEALLGTGFPFREIAQLEEYLAIFRDLLTLTPGIRRAGSAALDLAYVAAGRLDGFWEFGLKPWDTAAGSLLITEAGGLISDFAGGSDYLASGNVVAANSKIHKALLDVIQQHLIMAHK